MRPLHRQRADGRVRAGIVPRYEIVYPLTTEPWGLRRFFVRAPDGNVLNIVHHHE